MSSDPNSVFAPLNPEGPLVPGLTPQLLKRIYRGVGLKRISRVLGAKTRHASWRQVQRLLDRPQSRKQLAKLPVKTHSRCLLHNALYNYACQEHREGKALYLRLISPAERVGKDDCIYLEVSKFHGLLKLEAQSFAEEHAVSTGGAGEALLLFAVAYAFLQPDDAAQILQPLSALGSAYGAFLGVSTAVAERENAAPRPTVFSTGPSGGLDREALPVTSVVLSHRQSGSHALRAKRLRELAAFVELARQKRIGLGSSLVLDRKAFDRAADEEASAIRKRMQFKESLLTDARKRLDKALKYAESVSILDREPMLSTPEAAATWLDESELWFADLGDAARTLRARRATLARLVVRLDSDPAASTERVNWLDSPDALQRRITLMEDKIAAAQRWDETVGQLRAEATDCPSPSPSSWLQVLSPQLAREILQRGCVDDDLAELPPLLLRLLCDASLKESGALDCAVLDVFDTCVSELPAEIAPEHTPPLLAYLDAPTLQRVLCAGSRRVARYVVYFAFRETLLRRIPLFFRDIWPAACIGPA